MRIRRLLALLAALASLAAARAEGWDRAYGGRAEDCLYEIIPAADGLFAVGTTFSDDGELSGRTRAGETGWALRLDAEGEPLFSVCSAHAGRTRMARPFAHADGTLSCLLAGEGAGAEWLRLSAQGQVTARVETPRGLCPHGTRDDARDAAFCDTEDGPALLVCLRHADGGFCFARIGEDGKARQGEAVRAPEDALPCFGARGDAALVWTDGGVAHVALVRASGEMREWEAEADAQLSGATAAMVCEDGSVVFAAGAEEGGMLLRVSASGDTLFSVPTETPAEALAPTNTGFAARMGARLCRYDEEGAPLGENLVEDGALAVCGFGEGEAALYRLPSAQMKQARVVAAAGRAYAGPDTSGALYAREGGRLLAAQAVPEGTLLRIDVGDGQEERWLLAPDGTATEDAREALPQDLLRAGVVSCAQDAGGATVAYAAEDGELWRTHTPIPTAADRLTWRCAARTQDGLWLGGRYETGQGDAQGTQGVAAWLDADGVLRRIETVEGAQDVFAALAEGEDVILLVASDAARAGEADAALTLGGDAVPLAVPVEGENACLLRAGGALLCAGTASANGKSSAVVQALTVGGQGPQGGEP